MRGCPAGGEDCCWTVPGPCLCLDFRGWWSACPVWRIVGGGVAQAHSTSSRCPSGLFLDTSSKVVLDEMVLLRDSNAF